MSSIDLHFPNASCAHCAQVVRRSLKKVDGVFHVDVDRSRGSLVVEFDPTRTNVDLIRSVMERSGYPTRPLSGKIVRFPSRSLPTHAA